MRTLWLAAMAAACAVSAQAADITRTSSGYTYFNKPGADFAAHDADIADCRKVAGRLHQPMTQTTVVAGGGAAGAIGVAIGMAIAQAINDARAHPTNVENCMVVRGWRVVEVDKTEGTALAALDKKARLAEMTPWIGADQPHGQIVRTFGNEIASEPPEAVFVPSSNFGNTALSADLAVKPREAGRSTPASASTPYMARSARPPKPLKAQDLGGVPAGDALIVVDILGSGQMSLAFERLGPDLDTPAWVDGHPGTFEVRQAAGSFAAANGAQGQMLAFAVPPGRWRIASVGNGQMAISFCLGSPAFDVAAGDVVVAGSFDPDGLGHPDLTLDAAKAIFPALSGLGDKVRAASYVNGTQGVCDGSYAYAMEIAGRPFADGYAWGARALPAAPPAQAATTAAAPSPPPADPAKAAATEADQPPTPAPQPAPPPPPPPSTTTQSTATQ
ncbi:MAG TPA: hypothetical protein VGG29_13935 [Caulobacteraceae bacterium]|jgi:hypothetical protein